MPCAPHKQSGVHCDGCPAYAPTDTRILIIKLGAIGDVIRTTPLLRRLRQEFPLGHITWLTLTPAILPQAEIDLILSWSPASLLFIQQAGFDIVFNLDKDREACALLQSLNAPAKFGYTLHQGKPWPVNQLAEHKYHTGLFDDVSKQNTKPYVQEIFELCGYEFHREEYVFDTHEDKGYTWPQLQGITKPLIGLNTGCGDRWTTRLWSDEKWLALIDQLQAAGYAPVLLGGEAEAARNQFLHEQTGATYCGTFPLPQFINLLYQMDVIVTQVTMAMHIGIALRKPLVLLNNIFNPYEFDLYGRGQIVQPDRACVCYFRGSCRLGVSCMEELPAAKVLAAVTETVSARSTRS